MKPQKTAKTDAATPTVSFVSLGCPKALVDSERIITRLRAEGYGLSRDHKGADLVIVNTCGFLDSAQAESLDAIGVQHPRAAVGEPCLGTERERIAQKLAPRSAGRARRPRRASLGGAAVGGAVVDDARARRQPARMAADQKLPGEHAESEHVRGR